MLATQSALATDYTGTVDSLELWVNGNIAFTLSQPVAPGCTLNQFILNKSADGTRNMYAALLAAKKSGSSVRVTTNGCGVAEGYTASTYNLVTYLNVID
jgi:hypothetical protein